jgi:hypothetical protein
MKKILVLASVLVVATTLVGPDAFAGHGEVQGDAVRSWNNLALQTVRTENASDAQAARLYAMVNVAMYDAVNGTADKGERCDPALVPLDQGADGTG